MYNLPPRDYEANEVHPPGSTCSHNLIGLGLEQAGLAVFLGGHLLILGHLKILEVWNLWIDLDRTAKEMHGQAILMTEGNSKVAGKGGFQGSREGGFQGSREGGFLGNRNFYR
jgi:hypothetical protein